VATQPASGNASVAFFVIGLAFIAIGASERRVFLFVGITFLVIGVAGMVRSRRTR
jgi:hypothetical protein